jgi:glycerol-3-phosphate dehydrogenase
LIFCAALTASANGAKFYPYREVTSFLKEGGRISGVRIYDRIRSKTEEFLGEITINATGPWAGKIAQLAGVTVEVISFAGVMGVVPAKLCNHVVNRMRIPSDGDIMIPYGDDCSIMGTTATLVDDPDEFEFSEEDTSLLLDEGSELFPELRKLGFRRMYASVRPLLKVGEGDVEEARKVSRTYEIFDHKRDGVHGLVTISGGKLTTCRLMGEQIADLAARKLGVKEPSRTEEIELFGSRPDAQTQKSLQNSRLDYGLVKRFLDTVGTVDEERYMPALRLLMSYALSED